MPTRVRSGLLGFLPRRERFPFNGSRARTAIIRNTDQTLRHALAVHCESASRFVACGSFRIHLRNSYRGRPSRYRAAVYHGRTANGRLGRNFGTRRSGRDVFLPAMATRIIVQLKSLNLAMESMSDGNA